MLIPTTSHRSAPSGSFSPTQARDLGGPIDSMGARMSYRRNEEIYAESEPADYLYKVVSGTVRTSKLLADGRRQIGGFYASGDVFGLETGNEHSLSAEAISDCEVLVIKRSALVALAGRDHEVARQLWAITSTELKRDYRKHVH